MLLLRNGVVTMPTNPTTPKCNASVDRLTLGIDTPRGTIPSTGFNGGTYVACFDVETSTTFSFMCSCSCVTEEA